MFINISKIFIKLTILMVWALIGGPTLDPNVSAVKITGDHLASQNHSFSCGKRTLWPLIGGRF